MKTNRLKICSLLIIINLANNANGMGPWLRDSQRCKISMHERSHISHKSAQQKDMELVSSGDAVSNAFIQFVAAYTAQCEKSCKVLENCKHNVSLGRTEGELEEYIEHLTNILNKSQILMNDITNIINTFRKIITEVEMHTKGKIFGMDQLKQQIHILTDVSQCINTLVNDLDTTIVSRVDAFIDNCYKKMNLLNENWINLIKFIENPLTEKNIINIFQQEKKCDKLIYTEFLFQERSIEQPLLSILQKLPALLEKRVREGKALERYNTKFSEVQANKQQGTGLSIQHL